MGFGAVRRLLYTVPLDSTVHLYIRSPVSVTACLTNEWRPAPAVVLPVEDGFPRYINQSLNLSSVAVLTIEELIKLPIYVQLSFRVLQAHEVRFCFGQLMRTCIAGSGGVFFRMAL